ncbi:MAG: hypothetical protein J6K48_03465 [Lachnospiraceae bacterium]|nr:hypothetical protein [Lachnospiraceae bacterium]
MNQKEFYQEIGNIDDDLIQAANKDYGLKHNVRVLYRIAWAAACLCLICGGILFGLQKDTLYINDISIPMASKVIVPTDENTKIIPMTYQELLAYYGMEQLPDSLGEELTREEQSYFVLYKDQEDNVLCDTNILYYNSSDNSMTLSITLAKANEPSNTFHGDIKRSKINGVSMILASTDQTAYWASFKLNDISFKITSYGLNEESFLNIVKEFIRFVK